MSDLFVKRMSSLDKMLNHFHLMNEIDKNIKKLDK